MKRIYLLMIVLVTLASNAIAQKDLVILSNIANPSTYLFNSTANGGAKTFYRFVWGFKNNGATAFTTADTLVLRSPLYPNGQRLTLPTAGIPAGDTVYWIDTFGFLGPNLLGANPGQWCDTIQWRTAGVLQVDPTPADNRKCSSVQFSQDPLSISSNLAAVKNELFAYPNPASAILNVKYDFNGESNITVRDLIGRVVFQQSLGKVSGLKEYTIDISNFNSGIYMVEVTSGDNKVISKVTVQK